MQKELKQKILGIEPSRQIDIDIDQLVSIPEGQPHLFEDAFPHSEVPQFIFSGPVTEIIDGKPVTFNVDPHTSFWQRFGIRLLGILPIESQL